MVDSDDYGRITDPEEVEREWREIDSYVFLFQKQFIYSIDEKRGRRRCDGVKTDISEEELAKCKSAGLRIVEAFKPMINKYINLFKTGIINFNDEEQKKFVYLFMDNQEMKRALWRKYIGKDMRERITSKFNFVCECYGKCDKDQMAQDLNEIVLDLAQRYRDTGKSFCTFLYHSFNYTVARKKVKPYQKEILNFHYKKTQYEDYTNVTYDDSAMNDDIYEDESGLPDMTWINGSTCSDLFSDFTAEERNIISKYYLAGWNDSQIAESIGMHINTVNTKRRKCLKIIAEKTGHDLSAIKRNRRSGKKAIGRTV